MNEYICIYISTQNLEFSQCIYVRSRKLKLLKDFGGARNSRKTKSEAKLTANVPKQDPST